MLSNHQENDDYIVFVISEKKHLDLIPQKCLKVYITAELDTIKQRFAERMNGHLPAPVSKMLERNHGCFDNEVFDLRFSTEVDDDKTICENIIKAAVLL